MGFVCHQNKRKLIKPNDIYMCVFCELWNLVKSTVIWVWVPWPPYFSCFPFHSLSFAAIAVSPPSYNVLCHLASPSVPPVPIYSLHASQISSRWDVSSLCGFPLLRSCKIPLTLKHAFITNLVFSEFPFKCGTFH